MTCRECRGVADAFLADELLTETNHDILQHLATCPSCRGEIDARHQFRLSLRAAFEAAPDLQPSSDFTARLNGVMRSAARRPRRDWRLFRPWAMLAAASVVLVAGLTGAIFTTHSRPPVDALARDAIGDHWNCALKNRRIRTPVALEEAAQRFDSAYRVLLDSPPDETPTPDGPIKVVDRHACVFGSRRFGHVILEYRQHVVSLLVTADDEEAGGVILDSDLSPQLHGAPVNGLSVASIRRAHHAILVVSDLDGIELRQLSTTVSTPLVQRLMSGLALPNSRLIASF